MKYPENRTELLDACINAVNDAFTVDDYYRGGVSTEIETKDGRIEIIITPKEASVTLSHKNGNMTECYNLCKEIECNVPEWNNLCSEYWSMEDEQYSQDLDPAFKSWTDVNAQFVCL